MDSQANNALAANRRGLRLRRRGLLLRFLSRFHFIFWPLDEESIVLFSQTFFSLWEPLRNAAPCVVSNLSLYKLKTVQPRGCQDHRTGYRRPFNRAVERLPVHCHSFVSTHSQRRATANGRGWRLVRCQPQVLKTSGIYKQNYHLIEMFG